MVEQDFIMRMIKDSVKFLGGLLLGKDSIHYELPPDGLYTKEDYLHQRLLLLIREGNINDAENLLWEDIDTASERYMELALDFYQQLSEYSSDYLDDHNYSKEEVQEGLASIAREFGVTL